MSMDEQELIRRVQDGDEGAFGQIMGLYKDKIVNYLYQFSGDYQKAVELAQETFIRVYFKAGKYRPIAPLSSWIYTIASNLAKTECRRSRKMATVSLEDIPNNFSSGTYYEDPPRGPGRAPPPLPSPGRPQGHGGLLPGGDRPDHQAAGRDGQGPDQPRPGTAPDKAGKGQGRRIVRGRKRGE